MAIDWNAWNQIKALPSYGGLYDNGSSVAPGEDDFLNANNLRRFNDPNTPVSPEIAQILRRNGFAPTSTGDAQYQHGPGQAIQSPDGSWFWQTNSTPQTPKDYGIADQQNAQGITGAITKVMGNPLTYAGIAAGGAAGLFGGAAAGGAGALGEAGGFLSDLPAWAGGAADTSLGGGVGGLGLGGAAAPAIGSGVADAAGAGFSLSGADPMAGLSAVGGGGSGSYGGGGFTPDASQASALSRVLGGNGTADDYLKLAGTVGSTGLGILGSDAQRSSLNSTADKYLALGAPSRNRLEASYAPGFSMANEPGYKDALDQGTNSFLRAASAGHAPGVSGGNPMDNPGAWAETQKYVNNQFTLPQLNTYRSQNASQGGLGVNIAGTNSTAAAGTAGQGYNAAGYGLGQITNPTSGIDDWIKKLTAGGLGGLGGFKLNLGSGLT